MNGPLLRYTFGSNALRLVVIAAGLILMGVVMPVMYANFGVEMGQFLESVPFFNQIASSFGGGDLMSLTGSMALGFQHPFTLLLVGIMAIAFPALAIAGEREKGTLEVTLSRPDLATWSAGHALSGGGRLRGPAHRRAGGHDRDHRGRRRLR